MTAGDHRVVQLPGQGGAHGMPGRGFINYSRQQHKVLTLRTCWCRARKTRSGKPAGGAQQLADQHQADQEPEFVKTWPFQKTPNVALTYGGVVVKYETSTIAPYALGHVELKIPYPRLNGIIKPELFPGR
jgi:hypothetical protein